MFTTEPYKILPFSKQ